MRRIMLVVACSVLLPGVGWAIRVPVDRARLHLEKHWGVPVDPEGDCTFRPDRARLCIIIPGKARILSREIGQTNAPRVLRVVDGDFRAEVTVLGDLPTDPRCLTEGRWPYHGAGLLLWQDDDNYVRFERAHMRNPNLGTWRCYPAFEWRRGGKMARSWRTTDGLLDPARSVMLRVVRKGAILTASFRQQDHDWTELPPLQVDMGQKLNVGVHAVQNTPAGFEATLQRLTIVSAKQP